jgi:hypothetical protein
VTQAFSGRAPFRLYWEADCGSADADHRNRGYSRLAAGITRADQERHGEYGASDSQPRATLR